MKTDSDRIRIYLKFTSDWHIGTGAGIPGVADQGLLRDAEGYPYIPGRTIRGILRAAHEEVYNLPHFKEKYPDCAPEEIWGSHTMYSKEVSTKKGSWQVSNGELEEGIRSQLAKASQIVKRTWLNEFSFVVPRIALDPRRRVRKDHLAFIEMGRKGIGFEFSVSRIDGQPFSESEKNLLRTLLIYVRRLGGTRRRGKGSVELNMREDKNREGMLQKLQGGAQ